MRTAIIVLIAAMASLQFGYHIVAPFCFRVWRRGKTDWQSWIAFPHASHLHQVGRPKSEWSVVQDSANDDLGYCLLLAFIWPLKAVWNAFSLIAHGMRRLASTVGAGILSGLKAVFSAFFHAPVTIAAGCAATMKALKKTRRAAAAPMAQSVPATPYRVVQVEDPRLLEELIVALEVEHRSERQEVQRKYDRLESLSGMIAEHRRRLAELRGKIA